MARLPRTVRPFQWLGHLSSACFHRHVALALANLHDAPHRGANAIDKVTEDLYRINEHGKAVLKRNPSALTVKDH